MHEQSQRESQAAHPPAREVPARSFGQLWRQGERPDVQHFLAQAGTLTPAEVAAVLLVDQSQRWQQGTPIRAEAYLEKYAFLRDDSERVVDLIFAQPSDHLLVQIIHAESLARIGGPERYSDERSGRISTRRQ